jgi:uncharacterized membrane protein YccC
MLILITQVLKHHQRVLLISSAAPFWNGLPRSDGFALLAVCVAPILMIGSYINSFPATATIGLGFNIYFCFISNLTNPSVYDPASFLDTVFAMLLGIGAAALAFSVVFPYGNDWFLRSYLRRIRRQVSSVASKAPLQEEMLLKFESSMRDFVIQIQPHATDRAGRRSDLLGWAFAALELGRAIIQIRMDSATCAAIMPPEWPAAQRTWQSAVAHLFDQVTPEYHANALTATREALRVLPPPDSMDTSPSVMVRLRMRALLHATELSLLDEELPLNPGKKSQSWHHVRAIRSHSTWQ